MARFYKHFKENMDSLGLPAPESLFGSFQAAVANATVILSQIDKFGRLVTIRDLLVAGTRLERLAIIGACSASFYVGAVIGSIAVAAGRSLSGGTSIADTIHFARVHKLYRPWLHTAYSRYPALCNRKVAARSSINFKVAFA